MKKQNLTGKLIENTPKPIKAVIGKPLRRMAGTLVSNQSLVQLGIKHATDKLQNGYLALYQRHFSAKRLSASSIIEIGIGGYEKPDAGGESLRLWADYFPNAIVHGIDIYDKSCHNSHRIQTHLGSQIDRAFLERVTTVSGAPDIIIDDGSHINEHIITSFDILFPKLKPGGIYVIEDMGASYRECDGGDSQNLNNPNTAAGFVKCLMDAINSKHIAHRPAGHFDQMISGISVYDSICFLEKH